MTRRSPNFCKRCCRPAATRSTSFTAARPSSTSSRRAIRQAQPSAQVIMLSGRQAPATIIEAVRLGAADYVLKPGDPEGVGEAALEAAIRNALERQSLSAEVARLGAQIAEDPEGTQPYWGTGP